MSQENVIAVFDVGKTNKKLYLFNDKYQVVFEKSSQLPETVDEDGYPCEDIVELRSFVINSLKPVMNMPEFKIKAINFSAYGASFVNLDKNFEVCTPLYNYLKPYPVDLRNEFYNKYGGEKSVSLKIASPVLGNLNSGMQLYRLKNQKPEIFKGIKFALHLPQYLSFLITGKAFSDICSIGCHTNLWDFNNNQYHSWVGAEEVSPKLAPIVPSNSIGGFFNKDIPVGIGIHDSSAALIPYLISSSVPFLLVSTGTWCISFNPFNHKPLTDLELQQDCLCYLSYKGESVKASRLFAGHEHEMQTKRLSAHFNKPHDYFKSVDFNSEIYKNLKSSIDFFVRSTESAMIGKSAFSQRSLSEFKTYEEAYHQLMKDIMEEQIRSIKLVYQDEDVKNMFVEGGFSKNKIYMRLLGMAFPKIKVIRTSITNASALGAALVIHQHWNRKPLPEHILT
ncbi:MAG: FGGY-family carbohydrate kinase [Ginsengibacter sp.]